MRMLCQQSITPGKVGLKSLKHDYRDVHLIGCLALPKLNLQFLTLHDYLLRNLTLFQLESTCESSFDIYITGIYSG